MNSLFTAAGQWYGALHLNSAIPGGVNGYERFDCWDKVTSDYERDSSIQRKGVYLHQVYTYKINASLMDEFPPEQRMLFKLGGTLDAFIVCHEKIVRLFHRGKESGTKLTKISDY